jgi:ferrous iron transport protein A
MNSQKVNNETGLDDVPIGGRVYVTTVRGRGNIRGRLMAMGFVPGTMVDVLRRAPLGDPLEFCVKGYNLSLRDREASMVRVSPEPPNRPQDACIRPREA